MATADGAVDPTIVVSYDPPRRDRRYPALRCGESLRGGSPTERSSNSRAFSNWNFRAVETIEDFALVTGGITRVRGNLCRRAQ